MVKGDIQRSIDGAYHFTPTPTVARMCATTSPSSSSCRCPASSSAAPRCASSTRSASSRPHAEAVNAGPGRARRHRRRRDEVPRCRARRRRATSSPSDRRPTPRGAGQPSTADRHVVVELAGALGAYADARRRGAGARSPAAACCTRPRTSTASPTSTSPRRLRSGWPAVGRVDVDNDATCAALAEWRLGAGRASTDMVLVTLGTGIGGGVVAGGAAAARSQRVRRRVRPHGRRPRRPALPVRPARLLGALRVGLRPGACSPGRRRSVERGEPASLDLAGGDPEAVRGEHVQAAAQRG